MKSKLSKSRLYQLLDPSLYYEITRYFYNSKFDSDRSGWCLDAHLTEYYGYDVRSVVFTKFINEYFNFDLEKHCYYLTKKQVNNYKFAESAYLDDCSGLTIEKLSDFIKEYAFELSKEDDGTFLLLMKDYFRHVRHILKLSINETRGYLLFALNNYKKLLELCKNTSNKFEICYAKYRVKYYFKDRILEMLCKKLNIVTLGDLFKQKVEVITALMLAGIIENHRALLPLMRSEEINELVCLFNGDYAESTKQQREIFFKKYADFDHILTNKELAEKLGITQSKTNYIIKRVSDDFQFDVLFHLYEYKLMGLKNNFHRVKQKKFDDIKIFGSKQRLNHFLIKLSLIEEELKIKVDFANRIITNETFILDERMREFLEDLLRG